MSDTKLNEDVNNIEEKHKKTPLDIVNIVFNVIFYVFIVLLLFFSISQIVGAKEDKVKNIFTLGYETVQSDSMYPTKNYTSLAKKDSFEKGDLLWVKTLNYSDNTKVKPEDFKLKIGDIITFYDTMSSSQSFLNTHRIVDYVVDGDGYVTAVITQGDIYLGTYLEYNTYKEANPDTYQALATSAQNFACQNVSLSSIRAKYIGHWDNIGGAVDWLSNPKKGMVMIIIIAVAFVLFEMFMVLKNIMNIKTAKMSETSEKEKEEMKLSLEEERERIKKELLEELKKQQVEDSKEEDNSSSEEDKK